MGVSKKNLVLQAGATNTIAILWEDADHLLYKAVTAVASLIPLRLTVPGHGIPDGWNVGFTGFSGSNLNAKSLPPRPADMREATVVDANTIEFNNLALTSAPGITSAKLVMYAPRDLTGYVARMQIRASADSSAVLLSLASPSGGIVVDAANYKTTVTLEPGDTENAQWFNGVYDVELVSISGEVTRVLQGEVVLEKEVTR